MPDPDNRPIALVTGDIILAWDFIHRKVDADPSGAYAPEAHHLTYRQSGGAWHVTNMLRIFGARSGWAVHGVGPGGARPGDNSLLSAYGSLSHAFATWTHFPLSRERSKQQAVRVKSYLGSEPRTHNPPDEWYPTIPDAELERLRLVVASDDGIEDYADNRPDLWSTVVAKLPPGKQPWILWKDRKLDDKRTIVTALAGSQPVVLTDAEQRSLGARIIAVVGVDVLRRGDRRVGHGLSWDSIARETFAAVASRPQLASCRLVIVSFTDAGAVVVDRTGAHSMLIVDPRELEGTWSSRLAGDMVGSTTCLLASLAEWLMASAQGPSSELPPGIEQAIQCGLSRMRTLRYAGYGIDANTTIQPDVTDGTHDAHNPTTCYVTESYETIEARLAERMNYRADLQEGTGGLKAFHRIPWCNGSSLLAALAVDIRACSHRIALHGPKGDNLGAIPRLVVNDLITTDSNEIDALAGIRTLLDGYVGGRDEKPLSIAVFGQPGSGKSFGIKQLARSLAGRISERDLTFNLSQFSDPTLLIGALHQVRDEGLKGKVPLVFWDEFDTEGCKWLRYFLAPMQDGTFVEGETTRAIGRAIFVFAGGTRETMNGFYDPTRQASDRGLSDKLQAGKTLTRREQAEHDRAEHDRANKVPDFVSRLRGSLDVRGINDTDTPGAHTKLRRAIILHNALNRLPRLFHDGEVHVSPAVIDAFLDIPTYRHGARSLESIVKMSALGDARRFTASCLPSQQQLDLHVDGEQFLRIAQADGPPTDAARPRARTAAAGISPRGPRRGGASAAG